jgi:hypothetical protein
MEAAHGGRLLKWRVTPNWMPRPEPVAVRWSGTRLLSVEKGHVAADMWLSVQRRLRGAL